MKGIGGTDPTREEMLAFLAEQFGDAEEIDVEEAIHWCARLKIASARAGENSNPHRTPAKR